MQSSIDPRKLQRHWIHSHEEDSATERVYRPAGYAFPPSRGRSGFELRPDGSLIEGGIAAADGQIESQGSWRLDDGRLEFYASLSSMPQRVLEIQSVDSDKLIVKR